MGAIPGFRMKLQVSRRTSVGRSGWTQEPSRVTVTHPQDMIRSLTLELGRLEGLTERGAVKSVPSLGRPGKVDAEKVKTAASKTYRRPEGSQWGSFDTPRLTIPISPKPGKPRYSRNCLGEIGMSVPRGIINYRT